MMRPAIAHWTLGLSYACLTLCCLVATDTHANLELLPEVFLEVLPSRCEAPAAWLPGRS